MNPFIYLQRDVSPYSVTCFIVKACWMVTKSIYLSNETDENVLRSKQEIIFAILKLINAAMDPNSAE